MSLVNSNFEQTLSPTDYGTLILDGVAGVSSAFQAFDVVRTDRQALNLPVLTGVGNATWTAETEEIVPDDASYAEQTITPRKLSVMRVFSNEVDGDSQGLVGNAVVAEINRALALAVASAVFGTGNTAPAPAGLGSLTGLATAMWSGTDLDCFIEASSNAGVYGLALRNYVMNPVDFLNVAVLKESTGSARNLVEPSAVQGTARVINGVPVLLSSGVPEGTAYAIPK